MIIVVISLPVTIFRSQNQIISADSVKQQTYSQTESTGCGDFNCHFKGIPQQRGHVFGVFNRCLVVHFGAMKTQRKAENCCIMKGKFHQQHRLSLFSSFFWASPQPCLIESIFFPASLPALQGLIKRPIVCLLRNAQRTLTPSTSFGSFLLFLTIHPTPVRLFIKG